MQAGGKAPNPYIAGKAVKDAHRFFGREDILALVETQMASLARNALVLFGQRRIGKTSILLQLQQRLSRPEFCPVYFDIMSQANQSLGTALFELADAMAEQAALAPPERSAFDPEGAHFRRSFLPRYYEEIGEGRPLFLLDEFDVLDVPVERDHAPDAATRLLIPYFRKLMETEPRLAFVFVVGRKLDYLSIGVKGIFKTAKHAKVSVLSEEDATRLIRTAERDQTLAFTGAAVQRIVEITAGHPCFTQLLCEVLWETLRRGSQQSAPQADVADVEAAVPRMLAEGENFFQWIWDDLPPAERVIMATIAGVTNGQHTVTKEYLSDILQSHGVRILSRELDIAPDTLVEWDLLRQRHGEYRFFIEVLRRWVVASRPIHKVKDELYRISSPAENLYQSANGFYRRGELDKSIDSLRRAIDTNPAHLKARLLLAQILGESGSLADAIVELEKAYRYDENEVRSQFVRTLLLHAEHLEPSDSPSALTVYDRVLAISPGQRTALQQRAAIWTRSGDAERDAGDLESALKSYRMAGAVDRIRAVELTLREIRLKEAATEALVFEVAESWDRALAAYGILAGEEPEAAEWHEAVARVEAARELNRTYDAGASSTAAKDWTSAMASLANVVHIRPDYKDAAELLAAAVRGYRAVLTAPAAKPEPRQSRKRGASIELRGIFERDRLPAQLDASAKAPETAAPPAPPVLHEISSPLLTIVQGAAITDVVFNPWGESIAVVTLTGTIDLCDAASGHSLGVLENETPVGCVAFDSGGNLLASGCEDGRTRIWVRGAELASLRLNAPVTAVAFSRDSQFLACGSCDGQLLLGRAKTGRTELHVRRPTAITAAVFGPGQVLAAASSDGNVTVSNFTMSNTYRRPGRLEERHVIPHQAPVRSIALHPGASIVATACDDGLARIFTRGELARSLSHQGPVLLVGFSQSGATLMTAESGGAAHLWDSESGEELLRVYGPPGLVSASYCATTGRLATATAEGVHLWDVGIKS